MFLTSSLTLPQALERIQDLEWENADLRKQLAIERDPAAIAKVKGVMPLHTGPIAILLTLHRRYPAPVSTETLFLAFDHNSEPGGLGSVKTYISCLRRAIGKGNIINIVNRGYI